MEKFEIKVEGIEKGVTFKIGDKERTLGIKDVFEIRNQILEITSWFEFWGLYVKFYGDDYTLDVIEKSLDERFDEETKEYFIGENLGVFVEEAKGDNHVASKIVKAKYSEEFPENTLVFDPEYTYSYVYTKDREEAKNFKWWLFQNYITPTLDVVKKQGKINDEIKPFNVNNL